MIHRFTSTLLLSAALLAGLASCREPEIHGDGPVKSEARQMSGTFNRVEVDAPVDAEISIVQGATPSVNLNGYANVLPYIKMKVEDGVLKIYTQDEMNIYTKKNITANITLPSLTGLSIAGSSDAKVTGDISGNEFKVDMAGAGAVNLESLNVSLFDVDMAGSSEITIQKGNTPTASYDISGSGDIHAFNLQTTNTTVEVAGSGDAQVFATGKLDVSISGSGDVRYKGTPEISKDIAGSGSVESAN